MTVIDQGMGAVAVLLHGQPGQSRDWHRVVEALAPYMRVVVPDRPGYGATGGRAGGMAANADAVIAMLDAGGIDQAVIVGHSWGGGVALDLAQRYPERVLALVLAGSIGGQGSVDRLDRLLTVPIMGSALSLVGLAMAGAARRRRVRRRPVASSAAAGTAEAAGGMAEAERGLADAAGGLAHAAGGLAHAAGQLAQAAGFSTGWYAAWRSFVVEQQALVDELPAISARLGEVGVRVFVVVGAADRLVRPASQRDLAARLPLGEVVELARVGHLIPWEAPDRLAEVIVAAVP